MTISPRAKVLNSPKVSVVIPAYNAAKFIEEAIQSVLAQTQPSWELIVVDDGSTDNTAAIVQQYSLEDSRIHLIQQVNQGVSAARNVGVHLAQADYIAFLDADDRWLPIKLAVHLSHFQSKPNLGVSYARAAFISFEGGLTGTIASGRLLQLQPENFLYENPTITTSNLVVRRAVFEQLGGFDLEMSYSEDLDWLFRVLHSQTWQIEGINQVLIEYRLTGQGLSSSLEHIETGWNVLVSKARQTAPDLVDRHYSIAQAIHLRYLARQALRLKLPSQIGVDFMMRAWQSDWRILFKHPHRTLLTSIAVYAKHFTTGLHVFNRFYK